MVALLALMIGCAWITEDERAARRDRDGDGDVAAQFGGGDCDDRDASVSSLATETCNGVDDDCDGEIDNVAAPEGMVAWDDADGDGFGAPGTDTVVCQLGDAQVDNDADCDDTSADIKPGAPELCNDVDDDCDDVLDDADPDFLAATFWQDVDDDGFGDPALGQDFASCEVPQGYAANDGDCDDADPDVNPDAAELCSGVDEDCDGLIDDDDSDAPVLSWYADLDRDSYGDPDSEIDLCYPPAGHVSNALDCDDGDASIRPEADELCDEVDQDCDTDVDEDAIDQLVWYVDSDSDGWGDASDVRADCVQPDGYADRAGDCDDSEGTTYPGAEEACGVGVDSNCDGSVDTDGDSDGYLACEDCDDTDPGVNPAASEVCNGVDDDCNGLTDDDDAGIDTSSQDVYYADADGDGYGDPGASLLACTQPSAYVTDASDCDDSSASANPDMLEVCDSTSTDDDCDGATADCTHTSTAADVRWLGVTGGDRAGAALVAADFDSDGVDDLAIGAPDGGSVYVLYGPDAGGTLAGATELTAASSGDDPGSSLDAADTDADGTPDLLIGAPGGDRAYVVLGPVSSGGLSSSDAVVSGDSSGDDFGHSAAWVNNDGNGYLDALIGAPSVGETLSPDRGTVYLFAGPVTGSLGVADASAVLEGGAGETLGLALTGADTDGDGQDEAFVGATVDPLFGTDGVFVFSALSGTLSSSDADATLSSAGDAVTALHAGDVDGDGAVDLVVGVAGASSDRGQVTVWLGPVSTDQSFSSADATLTGGSGDGAGASVHGVPDLDGDGADELWVGGASGASAWLWYGGSGVSGALTLSDAALILEGSGDALGAAGAAGDLDGDGFFDLISGAPSTSSDAGAAVLLSGARLP